uniref:Cytochrome c oxidase subunit 3 n=1 Tax=Cantharellus lutescens TaxID=104198 RepID=A0A2S0S4F4_9AGAM|nr:cytochrome c oxidase subunit 3 [Cantharellus lutescens]AWA82221.1 cytochrome c oxidase subunit 3 [Cantharellus lutescens]
MKHLDVKRTDYQVFPFHLVDPSPWPILTSFALFTFTVSAVLYMHGFANGGTLLTLGFLLTAGAMTLWFRDVVTESTYLGHHTFEVKKGLTIGVALFIVSEVFAFLSVFWAYLHSSLAPTIEIGSSWPPLGITPLDPFAIPLLNTLVLLSSGAFITWSHHALIQGNRSGAIWGGIFTIILALIFTGLQYVEYSTAGFTIADSVYGTVFFAATGLHGLHIIVGTIFIVIGLLRIFAYHLTENHHLGYESAILYWHFVDVVWLFLFVLVYWWGS